MPNRHRVAVLICFALAALAGFSSSAQPTPPVERLSVFEGTWTREDAPATVTFRETCAWLAGGRRHMVCQGEYRSANRVTQMLKVFSVREQTYVVFAAIGDSPASTYTGGPDGDRWIFNLQSERPGNPQRRRIVITPARDRIRFVEESSANDGPWQTTEDYSYIRIK
jgi:hypothetical protein